MKITHALSLTLALTLFSPLFAKKGSPVYVDKNGIIRWDDHTEVGLFGANYCLPSACDYRAAAMVTNDLKKVVDADMLHFARMGWDALRLSFWGDFENSDLDGNLVNNDHLDLMDYTIYKAGQRGVFMLLSPIVTYDSRWPDNMQDTISVKGLSTRYKKNTLGIDPGAIKAQQNYLKQLLEHINPYTGNALKNEPSILFIEMINEPTHHSEDFKGSVHYINALVDAVKSTGCKKLLFHNVTQDIKIAHAVKSSRADGATFAWYPMGLVGGHRLTENHLRSVDDFTPMHSPILKGMPRLVYEFDEADSYTSYMYPAMTRAFRGVGAQYAAMFSYDMLATAPYNLGWQTHLMNMVYYPQKTVGAIISSQLMKTLPLYQSYGQYPENTTFGPCHISYEENLSEYNTPEKFIYSGHTKTQPVKATELKQVIGLGSSPIVSYQGKGIYFLDKLEGNTWRLEVYPDALLVNDPFEPMSPDKVVSRLISRSWKMSLTLPGLGDTFHILPLNKGNSYQTQAQKGEFTIRPGAYILTTNKDISIEHLPQTIGHIGLREFTSPPDTKTEDKIIVHQNSMYIENQPVTIRAEIQSSVQPDEVILYYRQLKHSRWFIASSMTQTDAYTWETNIPAEKMKSGYYHYCITVRHGELTTTYPGANNRHPYDWNFYAPQQWQFAVTDSFLPFSLLNLPEECSRLSFTRIGDGGRNGIFDILPKHDQDRPSLKLYFPCNIDSTLDDYTVSVPVKEKLKGIDLSGVQSILIRIKGDLQGQSAFLTFMEADGTSWSTTLNVLDEWKNIIVPLQWLKASRGVLLPLGFPERWNYWVEPALGRGEKGDSIRLNKLERVQISIRPGNKPLPRNAPSVEISQIELF